MSVTTVIPYLFIGLTGCLVDPEISCGRRKLVRTPRIIKKKKKMYEHKHALSTNVTYFSQRK
jgi:hypothetical protein